MVINKIVTIIGARPQFIKAASVSKELKKIPEIEEVIVHTGQHYDNGMSDVFFQEMSIPDPKYNLGISGLSHGSMTAKMIEGIEQICFKENPSAILVYGDTNSTLAAAIAGSKLNIAIIHVESGLRSFNMNMPEEVNRILTDRVSSLLLCPSLDAVKNLDNEGYRKFNVEIELVGDVMQDVALYYSKKVQWDEILECELAVKEGEYILFTCHRAENTDDEIRMKSIIDGINELSNNIPVVWPVHPRLKPILENYTLSKGVKIIEPLGYTDMIRMIKYSSLIITDSGGLQKEAYYFDKFCVTIRDETEWKELVENEYNFLVGTDTKEIVSITLRLMKLIFPRKVELYGGGKAARLAVQYIKQYLSNV